MTLPDESRDVFGKNQEIWNWMVNWGLIMHLRGLNARL